MSKSVSACKATLEPSLVVSFLDLFAGSFFEAISCEKTFVKSIHQKEQNQANMAYNPFQQNTNINVNLEQTHTHISLRKHIHEHTCVQDTLLPKNYIHAHSKHSCYLDYLHVFSRHFCYLDYKHVFSRHFAT